MSLVKFLTPGDALRLCLKVKELEKELFDSESERKRIEDHLENSVLTALKVIVILQLSRTWR